MKLRVLVVLALVVTAGPAFAQKVYIDYDKDYDFEKVKTFAWAETKDTSVKGHDPLMHSRIVNAIEHYLSMGGIHEVDSDPDIYVTYHTSTQDNLSFNTTSFGYGYPRRWYGGWYGRYGYGAGFDTATTTVSNYQTGTLLVDAWDPDTDKLVWRGTASNITVTQNPAKMEKKLDKALKKIVAKWDQLRAKGL